MPDTPADSESLSGPADRTAVGSVPFGDWMRSRGPFRQLRSALLDAEALLNGYKVGLAREAWQVARTVVGNDAAVIDALNDVFAVLEARPRIDLTAAGPRLSLAGPRALRELGAACAIAVLIDLSGCHRLKRCRRSPCEHVFIDWTNANSRGVCRFHPDAPTRPPGLGGREAAQCGSHEHPALEDD